MAGSWVRALVMISEHASHVQSSFWVGGVLAASASSMFGPWRLRQGEARSAVGRGAIPIYLCAFCPYTRARAWSFYHIR